MMKQLQNEPSGILIVDKPTGMTSHDVVNIIRRLYNTRRVGHTGTLDPMASGVLVVLVGRAAKASEYVSHDAKKYCATLKLGLTTDTEDITGEVLSNSSTLPECADVKSCAEGFRGDIMQVPPMYSALKVGGKKLVDLARQGVTVEREARSVRIYELECMPTEKSDEYILDVHCSGGTYIRTLCADIGSKLGCGGVMASLRRVEACGFGEDTAHDIEKLREMSADELAGFLIPTEKLFEELPKVQLSEFYERLCRGGCEIYQKKISSSLPTGQRVRIYGKGGFFALGEVIEGERCKTPEHGSAVKAIKTFDLG